MATPIVVWGGNGAVRLGGAEYEIGMNAKNAKAFRDQPASFVARARDGSARADRAVLVSWLRQAVLGTGG